MSWIRESSLSWLQLCCVRILKFGRIPKHAAFIMDGNRRYARKNNVDTVAGHTKGFDKLSEMLQWCLDLGIHEVTVYAFSIENFKRSEDEVQALMDLARQKFKRLMDEREKLMQHGVRIRVIGNLSLLPADIIKLIAEAELITKNNSRAILNVAFSYTGREEIEQAVNSVVAGVASGLLVESDITADLISRCLYTSDSPEPELVIRTSGEARLSDFMLWQVSYSYLHFTDVLWPDFTAWHLLSAVFYYQRACQQLDSARQAERQSTSRGLTQQAVSFLDARKKSHWQTMREAVAT